MKARPAAAARLRLGTRGSQLALVQAAEVRARLAAAHPDLVDAIVVQTIRTTGDAVRDRPLAEIGGKGLFTKEIDRALLDGAIDLAAHSLKDVETRLADGIVIAAVLAREDPRDVLVAGRADIDTIAALPAGASVGTSSVRRRAQLLNLRPDLEIVPLRGNVPTRLAKVEEGEVSAALLALAGLRRLGIEGYEHRALAVGDILPAAAQGAVGVTCRADDGATRERLAVLDHAESHASVRAERAMLAALDGSCRTPIGGLAEIEGGTLSLRALVAAPDGAWLHRARRAGPVADAEALGREAGEELRALAGPEFFAALE